MARKKPAAHSFSIQAAVAAMLAVAADAGWQAVSMESVAARSGIPEAELRLNLGARHDLAAAYGRLLDARIRVGSGNGRDRLFDLLMDRFEALNENRAGTIALLDGLRRDPAVAIGMLPRLAASMKRIQAAAGLPEDGFAGTKAGLGLTALYLRVLHVWTHDDSEDLSQTMAALDKALGKLGRAVDLDGAS